MDAYLLEEQSHQISSQPDLKWRNIRLLQKTDAQTKEEQEQYN